MTGQRLGLFEAFGIELELMIVDSQTLNVLPISDQLLTRAAGALTGEAEFGEISWSNELALHVIEFKVSEPLNELSRASELFQQNIDHANDLLREWNARLMPSAMHPWMNPIAEMRLWPHDYSPVYAAFDRIFNCSGHGWANLQSTHWNLPFADDHEFALLHAAIRVLLPLIPALTASSPIYDGHPHGLLDCRLDVYRRNSQRIPSIAGKVIPEPVYSAADYDQHIYQVMYRDIEPFDPDKTLQHVWLNARGAIARFDRGAIEIRTLDCQECPAADIALGQCIVMTLQKLVEGAWSNFEVQAAMETNALADTMWDVVRQGRHAIVPAQLSRIFGLTNEVSAGDLWRYILQSLDDSFPNNSRRFVEQVLDHGSLSERILRSLDGDFSHQNLEMVYRQLCDCLSHGQPFATTAR